MGFLKFLNRSKKQDLSSLDLPPEPPKLEGFDDNMPDLPDFPEITSNEPDKEFKFDFPEDKEEEMPKFPEMGDRKFTPSNPVPAFMPAQPVAKPQIEHDSEQEAEHQAPEIAETGYERPRRIFHHERRVLESPMRKEVYVRVDKFKMALDGISMIRNSLRKSDEALMKLENIKNAKDRSFDKAKSSIEDLQKNLIFIDKTLFKGE